MVHSTKLYIALFVVFLLAAIGINAWPASIHPDGTIGLLQIAASFVWLIILIGSVMLVREEKTLSFVFYYLSFGFVAGIVVYLVTFFERYWLGELWFDLVSGIQYPFYFLFAVPLFGFNAWLDVSYGQFAMFAGFAYIVLAIGVSVRSKKLEAKRLRY